MQGPYCEEAPHRSFANIYRSSGLMKVCICRNPSAKVRSNNADTPLENQNIWSGPVGGIPVNAYKVL